MIPRARNPMLAILASLSFGYGTIRAQDSSPSESVPKKEAAVVAQPDPATTIVPSESPPSRQPLGTSPLDPSTLGSGFDGVGGFGGAGGGKNGPGYSATWYPSRAVSGQGGDFGFVRQNLSVAAPVWRDGGDGLTLTASVRNSQFFTHAILPDTRRAFPNDLWGINVGMNYMHQFDNGWTGGLMTGFGSQSDRPFHSIDEMNANLGAFLRIPAFSDRDAWTFMIHYSPASTLNFPIPMIAYAWNPTDEFHFSIGLPLSMTWRPNADWTINLSYVPLTNVRARVTYRIDDQIHVFGAYENLTESYFLVERVDTRDRFFSFEQRLTGGVGWDLWQHSALELNAGYAFDRRYGEGRNQGTSLHDIVKIAPGPFLGLSFRTRF